MKVKSWTLHWYDPETEEHGALYQSGPKQGAHKDPDPVIAEVVAKDKAQADPPPQEET